MQLLNDTNAVNELSTIRDWLRFAVSCFNQANLHYGHGTDNAWDEAVALILAGLHLPLDINPQMIDARLTQPERQHTLWLLKQRIEKRYAVPYLTNVAYFAGLPFYVDVRVLIPRSPIAELIEQHFSPWINESKVNHILDMCTGSGCIATACALAFPEAVVDATDISVDALAVAEINVRKHQVDEQVHLHRADLFPPVKYRYDVIVSNPPYVSIEEMTSLPQEYLHEPRLALEAGKEGLDLVVRILQKSANYLNEHGILIVEVGNSQYALQERFPQVPFTWLDLERGGDGIFLLTAAQLHEYQADFNS